MFMQKGCVAIGVSLGGSNSGNGNDALRCMWQKKKKKIKCVYVCQIALLGKITSLKIMIYFAHYFLIYHILSMVPNVIV